MTQPLSPENADVSAVRKVSEKVGDIVRELLDCGFDEAIELIDALTKERDAAQAALRILTEWIVMAENRLECADCPACVDVARSYLQEALSVTSTDSEPGLGWTLSEEAKQQLADIDNNIRQAPQNIANALTRPDGGGAT